MGADFCNIEPGDTVAAETLDYSSDNVLETLRELTHGRGPDGCHRGRRHGRPRHRPDVRNKGITIRTAQQPGQRYMPRMLEHVQRGELDPSFLITHRMTLEESPQGYELFKTKQDGCLRAVFAP